MSCNDINKQQIVKENSNICELDNKIFNCLLMIDETICKIRANYLIFRKFITCTFCWIQCTNQFSYMREHQCVKHRNNDFIDTTKSLFSWWNRFDVSKIFSESISQTKCISRNISDHFQMIAEVAFERLFKSTIFQKIYYIQIALNAMYTSTIACA